MRYHEGAESMRQIAKSGQRENTLVIFTSDQGFAWGQHGFPHEVAPWYVMLRSG